MKAVQIKNLFFSYVKDNFVLKDVSLEIEEGDFIGIIGPNGGGKTTLIKLILGLLKPKKGSIFVFGECPNEVSDKIGYVCQSNSFDKNFPISVEELILMGSSNNMNLFQKYPPQILDRLAYLLDAFNLTKNKKLPISILSGGEMQKALIARALVSDPEILILDEPTANIDIPSEKRILREIFSKRKRTVLMVTHNIATIIKDVKNVISVQTNARIYPKEKICEHFALGLYHFPLIEGEAR